MRRLSIVISHTDHMVAFQATGSSPEPAGQGADPDASPMKIAFITTVGCDEVDEMAALAVRVAARGLVANHSPQAATETPEKRPPQQLKRRPVNARPTFHRRWPVVGHLPNPTLETGVPIFKRGLQFEIGQVSILEVASV
jgi:hypothetical protein